MDIKAINDNVFAQVVQYWKIVVRYRWWIFLCTVAVSLAAISYIAVMQDVYQATTTILVDPQKIPERYVSTTVVADPAQRLGTISQEVLSTTRLQEIITEYNLYPGMQKSNRDAMIAQMRNDVAINVQMGGGGALGSFSITYSNPDRWVVAKVANELAQGFIKWNLASRDQQVTGTTDFLKSELERARENLREQEAKLGEFKLQHVGEMPDQQVANLQMLTHLQSQLDANREALNRLDTQRTQALRSGGSNGSSGIPGASKVNERSQLLGEKRDLESRLFELRKRYTPEFPDIVAANKRLGEVNARLRELPLDPVEPAATISAASADDPQIAQIDRSIKQLNDEQKQILGKIRTYQGKVEAAPVREQQILDLNRNYQVSSANYASLLDKTYNSELAGELEKRQKGERFTIVDLATTPERPFKPNRRMLMMMSILGALAFAVATAFAKELTNTSVKGENELNTLLADSQLPLLITIPVIETPAMLRRRKLWVCAGIVATLLACGLEILFLLKVKPIL